MNIVTIGFSRPTNVFFPIFSWLIRIYEQTPYSHVFLKFYSEELQEELIFEAVSGGVRLVSSKVWEKKALEVKSFDVTFNKTNKDLLLKFCISHAGIKYGLIQNIGLVIARLLNLKGNPVPTGMNCSELIGKLLKIEGYAIGRNLNLVTPKDIYTILDINNIK